MSENPCDLTPSWSAASIDQARYWFEQYRSASNWEARLIRDIQELSSGRVQAQQERE